MPAKKNAQMKTKTDPVTGAEHVVLSDEQQGLADELAETGVVPAGWNYTPHNAHNPFTRNSEEVTEEIVNDPPAS